MPAQNSKGLITYENLFVCSNIANPVDSISKHLPSKSCPWFYRQTTLLKSIVHGLVYCNWKLPKTEIKQEIFKRILLSRVLWIYTWAYLNLGICVQVVCGILPLILKVLFKSTVRNMKLYMLKSSQSKHFKGYTLNHFKVTIWGKLFGYYWFFILTLMKNSSEERTCYLLNIRKFKNH